MSPRGERRKARAVKMSDDEWAVIVAQAEAEGFMWAGKPNPSQMIRVMSDHYLNHFTDPLIEPTREGGS